MVYTCVHKGGFKVDTDSDFMLAQMLQQQYDQEHDTMISAYERKYNGDSKGIENVLCNIYNLYTVYIYNYI